MCSRLPRAITAPSVRRFWVRRFWVRRGRWLAVLALLCSARFASAQQVELTLTPEGRTLLENALGQSEAEIQQRLETELEGLYGVADVRTFLRLSANAQSMSNKGVGVDYASNPEGLLLGIAVNATADAGDVDLKEVRSVAGGAFERAVPVGAGAQISLMAGYNFSAEGLPGLTVFANGLAYPLRVSALDGEFYNLGLHAQYRLFGPVGVPALVEWGGIGLTTGLELSRARLTLDKSLRNELQLGSNVGLNAITGGRLELIQRALTIPVEVSTNLRLLYFLSFFGGAALDFQLGGAKTTLDVNANLLATDGDGGEIDAGTAHILVDESGHPTAVMPRFMVGAQLNIGALRGFVQLNLHAADLTLGVAAGCRIVL